MRFKPLVVTASVLLVAALAAIGIAVQWLVPRQLVPALAASVKAGTGRELGVGEVGVTLWPRPALVLSQVRFGNAPWGSLPWLAQAGRASVEFDVLGLLSGRLRIRQVTVTDASVLVETDADGVGNWVMGSSGAGKPAWPDILEIDALALKALALTYRDGKTGKAMAVQIDSARIAVASPSHSIDLSGRGTFDGKPVEAAGTTGPLAALIANTPFPVDLEGKIGAASIGVRGSVEKPRELGGFSLALRAQAAEFADVAALFGAAVLPLGPAHGAAQLNGSVAAPVFTGIDLVVGAPARMGLTARGDLKGEASAAGGYEWQSGGIDLLAEGAQFSDLAHWLGTSLPALGPYRIAARVAGSTAAPALPVIDIALGGRGMPQITLRGSVADLRTASGIDMKVAASATHWWRLETATQGPRLPPFQASARVRSTRQGYRVDDLELKIADSAVNASLQVVQGGPRLRVVGKVTSPLIDLARLPPAPGATTATAAAPGSSRPADHWKLADVDLELQIGRLVLPDGRELQSGSGRLALDNGRLNATALQARLGGGTARLDGSVADPANLAGIELGVALQGGELAELFKFFGTSTAPMGPYQGQARLSGSLDALRLTAIDAAAGRPGQRLRASGQIDDALRWQGIALAITAQVSDSKAAGRLFGADLPRLPALQATARLSGPQGGYVFDDLKLALGRTSVQGRVAFAPGEPRPRVTASLGGSLVDLSELMPPRPGPGAASPTLAVDVEADLRLDRVVLPDRRALGPVSGVARLTAGAVELKQFSVAVDGASAIVDGTIGKPLMPAELDLVVSAEVKRGAGLATFTGLNLRALPPFTASARLTDVPGGYALTGLKAAHAAATMTGDVALTRAGERFKVSATLRSPTLDASALAQPDATGGTAKPAAEGARVIADVPLPLEILRVIDADIDLRVDAVKFGDAAPLGPLLVRAAVADGHLKVEPMQLAGPANQMLSLSATVDAAQAAWDLSVDGNGIDAGAMFARFGHPGVVTGGSTDLTLRLRGRGKTLAAVLGSLDGDARVAVGPLRLHNLAVNFDRGIFTRALGLANPSHKTDPDTDFECLAAHVPISKGILTADRSVAAETAKYNVVLSGTVNLRTEGIDAAVTPVVKSGLGVGTAAIASIVRVGGTLGAPVVGVDPVGVAKSAVAAGAAVVATPWWLADAALKKLRSDPNPCKTALAK